MGFIKDAVKDAVKKNQGFAASGWVASSDFPVGTRLAFELDMGEKKLAIGKVPVKELILTLPNGDQFRYTHENVRYAAVLCMGGIAVKAGVGASNPCGTKYKVEFTDGKIAVITVCLDEDQERLESVIF